MEIKNAIKINTLYLKYKLIYKDISGKYNSQFIFKKYQHHDSDFKSTEFYK